jgi:hypothetical protein
MARSIGYQLAQHADHSDGMLCGLTEQVTRRLARRLSVRA